MSRKAYHLLLTLFSVIAMLYAASQAWSDLNRQKLAVLPFIAKNMDALTHIESLSSLLVANIDRRGYFEIFERKKTEQLLELEGVRIEELTREEIFRIGTKNGVDFILIGNVTRVGSSMSFEMELLNSRDRKVCLSETIRFSELELSGKLGETAAYIVRKAGDCSLAGNQGGAAPETAIAPPANVRAVGTPSSIRISWSHPAMSRVIGFKLFRSVSEYGPYTQIATNSENVYKDDNLKLNEAFFYKVSAISKSGSESTHSAPVSGKTSIAPNPPILLTAKGDIKSVHIVWRPRPGSKTPDTEEAGYRIYRRMAGDKEFMEAASLPADRTEYKDAGLKDGTTYAYSVSAFNSGRTESELSPSLDALTLSGPEGLKAVDGKIRRVPLAWTVHIQEAVEGYRIYRSSEKAGTYGRIGEVKDRLATSFTDKDLQDNKTYWYRITAYNKDSAETDMSEPVKVVTRGVPPSPGGLSVKSREPRRVPISWERVMNPDDEIKGYRIYRASVENGDYKNIGKTDDDRNSFIDEDQPLKDDTTYFYRVSAFNSAGAESLQSLPVSAVTKAVPRTPAGVKTTSGAVKKTTISWAANTESDIREYEVYRKVPGDKDWDRIKTVREGTSYTDDGLKDGTEYTYAVRAIDKDKLQSMLSEPVVAVTKALPVKPTGLKLEDKDGKKVLSWNNNPEKDIRQYNVLKSSFMGASKIISIQGNSWVIQEQKGKLEFFVTAEDDAGLESEKSNAVEVTIGEK
jgi:fibronectin type 3 domain-containing protein/TolB-like protein